MNCGWCQTPIARGRYCSTRHRVAAHRERRRCPWLHVAVTAAGDGNAPGSVTASRSGAVTRPGPEGVTPPRHCNADLVTETVAALYVRADGHYADRPDVDAWPECRDASQYQGPHPVVAHPPCAPWGAYRNIAPTRQRADLAVRAVDQVRWYGGVLEHPARSHLWAARDLPEPGQPPDQWGGWSLLIRQSWWGHRAPKPTWLYIVGRDVGDTPAIPPPQPDPGGRVLNLDRRDREMTPAALAAWLVELARGCRPGTRRRLPIVTGPAVSPARVTSPAVRLPAPILATTNP